MKSPTMQCIIISSFPSLLSAALCFLCLPRALEACSKSLTRTETDTDQKAKHPEAKDAT